MKKTVNEILIEMNQSGLADKASGRLRLNELTQLYEISCDNDIFEFICACYNFGFYKGMRSEKRKHAR